MAVDILPDSRCREARGVIRSPHGNLVPIFCMNCGRGCGSVGEKHIRYVSALCDPCVETHGAIAGAMADPDYPSWVRRREAEAENDARGLELVAQEWARAQEKVA